jgi:hypothetical protein
MRMPGRRRFRLGLAAVALGLLGPAGCATINPPPPAPNPLMVPSTDFETVWMACITSVDDYFDIASENRLQMKIVTEPRVGATIFEPWSGDSVGFYERLESTLQTIRRHAVITVSRTPTGAFAVKVEVNKELEDMIRPERQNNGRAVFDNEFPVNRARDYVGPVPLPNGYIPRGRDVKLERAILAKIKEKLFL